MTEVNSFPEITALLIRLGYRKDCIQEIRDEFITLFKEIDFDKTRRLIDSAIEGEDKTGLINLLQNLMVLLETKGYYRPDIPRRLLKLLVNGLNHRNEDIFEVLDQAEISEEKKRKEKEFLVSCAAITQLGYILLSCLILEVKVANAGPHVFLIIDSFSPNSMLFIDFSLDSIQEINVQQAYHQRDDFYYLKNKGDIPGLDKEVSMLLTEYYSFFQITTGSGLGHNIHNNLGIAYDTAGRSEEAIDEIYEALRLNPEYIEAHNNLPVIYHKMGRYEDSIKKLQDALRLNPEYPVAHYNLGNVYAELKRYDEAITELQEAIRLNPNYAPAHNSLGNIYADQKRHQEAICEFQKALILNPEYALAHSNLGYIYYELNRYEDAVREFEEAIRLDSQFVEAHYGIGLAYYNMDKYDRAAHALIRAVYLKPELMNSVPETLRLKVTQGISRLKFSE